MGWIADRSQLKPKEKNPNPPTAHNFESSHVYTCQTLTSFPWKVGSFYNKSMHNVSALLGILIRHLRVKTTSLAVRLQIFFRLFLFIIGKGRSMIKTKHKSYVEINRHLYFLKTTSHLSKINQWENLMVLKCWLPPWVHWNLLEEETAPMTVLAHLWASFSAISFWRALWKACYTEAWRPLQKWPEILLPCSFACFDWCHRIFPTVNRFMFDLVKRCLVWRCLFCPLTINCWKVKKWT